jgi:hypothetical protein
VICRYLQPLLQPQPNNLNLTPQSDWEGEAQIEVGGYNTKSFDAAKRKGFGIGLAAALDIDPAEVFVTTVSQQSTVNCSAANSQQ